MRSLRLFAVIWAFLATLFWTSPAFANAPAPPSYAWFHFQNPTARSAVLQGVQLAECRTQQCLKPVLLLQSGICTAAGCLRSPPILSTPHRFQCANHACLFVESQFSPRSTGAYYQLIAQFSDRLRISPAFRLNIRDGLAGYSARNLNVTVGENDLAIAPDTTPMKPTRWEVFGTGLALTEITELTVAGLFLRWRKFEKQELGKLLVAIAFINLLTFPVVWFFFPSLQPFQYTASRVVGTISLGVAILFSLLLVKRAASLTTITPIRNLFIAWLLTLPLVLFITFIAAFIFSYGEWLPSATGLPTIVTLPASEIFAVVWETWLIHRLSQGNLSLPQSSLLSVLTNGASLILGLLLLPALQPFG
jgi:hypothetical protein